MDLIKRYPAFLFYILVACVHIALLASGSDLARYSKMGIAVCLVIIALIYFHKKNKGVSIALIAALIMSGCGDYALIRPGFAYFLAGVGFFWVAHILYLVCFYFLTKNRELNPRSNRMVLGGVTLLTLVYLAYLVPGHVGPQLKLPITIYAFTLLWMFLKAYKIQDFISKPTAKIIGIGAFFFILSDGLLSYNLWVYKDKTVLFPLMVISTYIIAQGLISYGLATLHKKE